MNNKTPDILKKIISSKEDEVDFAKSALATYKKQIAKSAPALDFKKALSGRRGLSVIAEIKKASPSAGIISKDFNPVKMAESYRIAGADAVSVLTDVKYFKGSPGYIPLLRKTLAGIPILRKDFIIDASQIFQSRALQADTFLLIAAVLSRKKLSDFISLGRELGMEPLVEVHTVSELNKALLAGASIIGVNNRNLHTFEVDLKVSDSLIGKMPAGIIAVSESGIRNKEDAHHLFSIGFSAILAGEVLMRAGTASCAKCIAEFKRTNSK